MKWYYGKIIKYHPKKKIIIILVYIYFFIIRTYLLDPKI